MNIQSTILQMKRTWTTKTNL